MKNNSIMYRIPVCIFLFVSGTIISVLFSNALNDMIVYGRLTTQLTDPGALIGNIFTQDKLGRLFFLLEALVVLICIVYFVCAKRTYQADTYAVTDPFLCRMVRDSTVLHGSCPKKKKRRCLIISRYPL